MKSHRPPLSHSSELVSETFHNRFLVTVTFNRIDHLRTPNTQLLVVHLFYKLYTNCNLKTIVYIQQFLQEEKKQGRF